MKLSVPIELILLTSIFCTQPSVAENEDREIAVAPEIPSPSNSAVPTGGPKVPEKSRSFLITPRPTMVNPKTDGRGGTFGLPPTWITSHFDGLHGSGNRPLTN